MHTQRHPLLAPSPGTQREIVSHHFGSGGAQPRIYIQAGLHAGEIPGMLVARHLLPLLAEAEASGQIAGEIIVVPVANPIGLAQHAFHEHIGRFELCSMENFNRNYPDLAALIGDALEQDLGADAETNQALIRAAMRKALEAIVPATELASLRRVLLGLACEADMVLDMHCDCEAVCHLYTTDSSRDWGAQLSAHIGGEVVLLASCSGGNAFDEACSTPWDALRARFGQRFPIPLGCRAATIEWRGFADVNDTLAAADAHHVLGWLRAVGALSGAVPPAPSFEVGDLVPLAGTDDMLAPFGGILSFRREIGARVAAGEVLVDVIDPLSGARAEIATRTTGLFYAREHRRFVPRGASIAQVAGATPIRSGNLLAAR